MHGREVDRVPHDAVAQEVADGRGRIETDQFLRFFGRRRDVRRGDDLRQLRRATSRPAAPSRTRRAPAPATIPLSIARRSAASSISSPRAVLMMRMPGLHAREPRVVEQVLASRASTAGAASGSRPPRTARRATAARRRSPAAISREMNGSCATIRMPNARARVRHFLADAAEAGDAERLAAQLGAEEPSSSPTCRPSSPDRRPAPMRASASISAQACSATLMLLAPGALTTRTPRRWRRRRRCCRRRCRRGRRCAAAARRRAGPW